MDMDKALEAKFRIFACEARMLTLKTFHESGQRCHYGGSFSSAEILSVLYNGILKIDPSNPKWESRDHFILSKGHMAGMFYSVLALGGFFDKERLSTYCQLDSAFGMHTTLNVPGCDFAAGSLGHGLGVGVGLALAKKLEKMESRVFVHMGDGELNEGSVWEAAMSAAKYKLSNITATVDRNHLQIGGCTEDIMPLDPLEDKWKSFGWSVKTVDGHDVGGLFEVLSSVPFEMDKPSCIIAETIKCKGIAFLEGKVQCHIAKLKDQEYLESLRALEDCREECLRI